MLAIYTRLSKEDLESTSIENQQNEGIAFAKEHGLTFRLYNEGEGVSGTVKIENRPILLDLVNDVRKKSIKHVWMRNQNRLARDEQTYHGFISQMIKHEVSVYFDNKLIDFNDPSQSLMGSILSSINAYQAKLQGYQTRKVLNRKVKENKAWGVIPYGYMTEDMYLVVNDEEANIVKEIFDLAIQGWGAQRISTKLNHDNVPTRYNKIGKKRRNENKYTNKIAIKDSKEIVWVHKTVSGILRNKWYIGERIYSGEQYPVPIIIDKVVFYNVQKKTNARKYRRKNDVGYKYLLKGKLRCKCGCNFYGRFKPSGNDNYYMCSSKRTSKTNCGAFGVNIVKLESFIIKHLFESENLIKHLEVVMNDDTLLESLSRELKDMTNDITQCTRKIIKYTELFVSDLQDDGIVMSMYKKEKEKLDKLNDSKLIILSKIYNASSKQGLNDYKTIYDKYQNKEIEKDFASLRIAVDRIISEIIIDGSKNNKGGVEIRLVIKYNNIDLKKEHSSLWVSDRPLSIWTRFYTIPTAMAMDELSGYLTNNSRWSYEYDGDSLEKVNLLKEDLYYFNK